MVRIIDRGRENSRDTKTLAGASDAGKLNRQQCGIAVRLRFLSPRREWFVDLVVAGFVAAQRAARKRSWVIESGKDRQVESLAAFATRRLGREAYEWLAQPLAAGIYGGDPRRLSMQAAFPQFIDWEQRHGSLTAAMQARAADSGAKQAPGLATTSWSRCRAASNN